VKPRAEGRENGAGLRPGPRSQLPTCPWPRQPLKEQVARQVQVRKYLWKTSQIPWDWCKRVVLSEPACAALEHFYEAGIELREVFHILGQAALYGRGTWRHMKPSAARQLALVLRSVRPGLEAIEAAKPYDIRFRAMWGDADRGAVVHSFALFMSDWLPRYLDQCADGGVGVVTPGQRKDRVLQRCAGELATLVEQAIDSALREQHYADIGALLKAAFPERFHTRPYKGVPVAAEDDHADAARDVIRRARGKRR